MKENYILLKDIFDAKAGVIFMPDIHLDWYNSPYDYELSFPARYVENNKEWFCKESEYNKLQTEKWAQEFCSHMHIHHPITGLIMKELGILYLWFTSVYKEEEKITIGGYDVAVKITGVIINSEYYGKQFWEAVKIISQHPQAHNVAIVVNGKSVQLYITEVDKILSELK